MQKLLIAQDLTPLLMQDENFLSRASMQVFTAASNDELLATHIEENADLIITRLDLPGISTGSVFEVIRQVDRLKEVLVIMACDDNAFHGERCRKYGAHAVLTMPIEPALLQEKVWQFLNVAPRRACRSP